MSEKISLDSSAVLYYLLSIIRDIKKVGNIDSHKMRTHLKMILKLDSWRA